MLLIRHGRNCAVIASFSIALSISCRSTTPQVELATSKPVRIPAPEAPAGFDSKPAGIQPVAYSQQQPQADKVVALPDDPFAGQTELHLPEFVAEVLNRNPSLQAATAAWQAAAQRYPQVVSLDDPMFGFMLGPGSWGNNQVDSAYMVEASQKIPWPGKRQLRGEIADAEATAASFDVRDTELRLEEAAKLGYFDYYLVHRERELYEKNLRIMQEFRNTASTKYQANQVTQQDVLQADVELAQLKQRSFELDRAEQVAEARINTLLHRPAHESLPPPPSNLPAADGIPSAVFLQQLALERRPDLAATAAKIQAERASVALACREFHPDLEVVGRYDAFWQEDPLRPAVGMNLNVPLQKDRRRAAVREAMFRVNQRQAEFDQQVDAIGNEVQGANARLVESRRVIELYQQELLPIARQNVDSARSGYVTAKADFLRLVEAQRQYIMLQERSYEAETNYHRRLAELERLIGGRLPSGSMPTLPSPE